MPSLAPTLCVESFAAMSFAETATAAGRHIRTMSLDGDRFVVPHGGWNVPQENLEAAERLAAEYRSPDYGGDSPIIFVLNSNAGTREERRRIEFVAAQLAEATDSEVPAVTSNETGHLKPHRAQYLAVRERSGVPLEDTAHADDQWTKGVVGAILAGCAAGILAPPYGSAAGEHPGTRVQRLAEAGLRPFFGLPFKTSELGDDTTPKSERYQRAEHLSAALALGLGLEGAKLILDRKKLSGAAAIAAAAGVTTHAVSMRRAAGRSAIEEGLQAIIDRYHGGEPEASA